MAGVAGALTPDLRPGDIVVASEILAPDGRVVSCLTDPLVAALSAAGLRPWVGRVASVARLRLSREERTRLVAAEAIAVDMESAWLSQAATTGLPFVVLRAISDTPDRPLWRPVATVLGGIHALRALRKAAPALRSWAGEVSSRRPPGTG